MERVPIPPIYHFDYFYLSFESPLVGDEITDQEIKLSTGYRSRGIQEWQ